MKELGIEDFRLAPGDGENVFHFCCQLPPDGAGSGFSFRGFLEVEREGAHTFELAAGGTTPGTAYGRLPAHARPDLGVLGQGAFDMPDYTWGHASSPIIYKNVAIVQCDQQKGSFLAAFDLETGKEAWRTSREALPSGVWDALLKLLTLTQRDIVSADEICRLE